MNVCMYVYTCIQLNGTEKAYGRLCYVHFSSAFLNIPALCKEILLLINGNCS